MGPRLDALSHGSPQRSGRYAGSMAIEWHHQQLRAALGREQPESFVYLLAYGTWRGVARHCGHFALMTLRLHGEHTSRKHVTLRLHDCSTTDTIHGIPRLSL